ncbi:SWIM zinc finger family protein [Myxococcota bacterium]|nr:SWIM zinc finger family protein [Myxococcota bacterium]
MRVELSYLGRSQVSSLTDGLQLSFAPNLARPRVFFDGEVKSPLRYREAMSALHAVVVSDLRFTKRSGGEAYKAWLAAEKRREEAIRRGAADSAKVKALSESPGAPPPGLEKRFRQLHRRYWDARISWTNDLIRNDPELWRALVPCDPVITVAPDVVFFEGFAKDESSYGCLLVDRDAFEAGAVEGLGTTNVDYSMALYESFQTLRTYRRTRLVVDPTGFDVEVEGREDHREEKIDLPPSWLRGFGQLSAAMALPSRTVTLDPGTIYSILTFLKRNREKSGPRSLVFELTPGRPAKIVLEPWNHTLISTAGLYDGPRPETIKVWGRRRLAALARTLPLAERVDVRLLGTGLPSLWSVVMGEMRFVLGLSGWTVNDWTSGAGLDLLAGFVEPDPLLASTLATHLAKVRSATTDELVRACAADRPKIGAALHLLAKQGQVIYDFAHGLHRYRPILSVALSESVIGPEPEELRGAKELLAGQRVRVRRSEVAAGLRIFTGDAGGREVELGLDADGVMKKGRCDCSHYFKNKLKQGPCRHLLALRMVAMDGAEPRAPQAEGARRWS